MNHIGRLRQYAPTAAAALLFAILTAAQLAPSRASYPAAWSGYLTLLVGRETPIHVVVEALARGVPRTSIVSAATSTASVTLVGRLDEVRVDDLPARLDPLDPRWDPYLRKLPALFRADTAQGPMHVLYLKALPTPGIMTLRVARLLRGVPGTWRLPEAALFRGPLALTAAVCFLVLLAKGVSTARARRLLFWTALPWLAGCLTGGLGHLLALYLVLPFCAPLLGHLRTAWPGWGRLQELQGPGTASGIAALGASLVASVVLIAVLGGAALDTLKVLACLLADFCLLSCCVFRDRLVARPAQHRVFVPVIIGRRLAALGAKGSARYPRARPALPGLHTLVMTAIVCVSPFIYRVDDGSATTGLPAPIAVGGRVSWDGLHTLWLTARDDKLPNLSDYVAHEAYQGSLAWGGVYELPAGDQELGVIHHSYRSDPPGVISDRRTVTRYTDGWLRDTLTHARPGSVGALLASQGRSARVQVITDAVIAGRLPALRRTGIVFGIAGLVLVLACTVLAPTMMLGGSRAWPGRRQQEA